MNRYQSPVEPTEAQKKAGNYKKPRMKIAGMEIAIENPAGSIRSGIGRNGKWETRMIYPYGYVVGSKGSDGDAVDCYVGQDQDADTAFVIHQVKSIDWTTWDEDKVMLCFDSIESAKRAYLLHYDDPRFLGSITAMPIDEFKQKVFQANGDMVKAIVDLSDLSCGCADYALEMLSKAISEDSDPWRLHDNLFISHLIELFTDKGLTNSALIRDELARWIAGHRESPGHIPTKPGMSPVWTSLEQNLVKLYLQSIPKTSWTLEDWDYLISYLFQKYLPYIGVLPDAEWLVSKAYMLGKIQAALETIEPGQAKAIVGALPHTIAEAGKTFSLGAASSVILEYGKLRTAEMIVLLTDNARRGIKGVVLDHMAKRLQGDQSATNKKLEQTLFDRFDMMNRDWRRIAVTEAGEMANQGVISALKTGEKVKRVEMYHGACHFCRKIDGRVFNVVSPDDPNKDGETDVWVGKTNYGRSASPRKQTESGLMMREPEEMWWPAAGVQHPHCRGRFERVEPPQAGDDQALTKWFEQYMGVKSGLKLSEWAKEFE